MQDRTAVTSKIMIHLNYAYFWLDKRSMVKPQQRLYVLVHAT